MAWTRIDDDAHAADSAWGAHITRQLANNTSEIGTARHASATFSPEQYDGDRFSFVWAARRPAGCALPFILDPTMTALNVVLIYEVLTNPSVALTIHLYDGERLHRGLDTETLATTAGAVRTTLSLPLTAIYPGGVPSGRVWLVFEPVSAVSTSGGADDVTLTRAGSAADEYSRYHIEVSSGTSTYDPSLWTITDVNSTTKISTYENTPFYKDGPHEIHLNDDNYYWFYPPIDSFAWGTTPMVITRCGELTVHSVQVYPSTTAAKQDGPGSDFTALRRALAGDRPPSGVNHAAIQQQRDHVMRQRPPIYAWGPWQRWAPSNKEEEPAISPLTWSESYQTLGEYAIAPADQIAVSGTDRNWRTLEIWPFWLLVVRPNAHVSRFPAGSVRKLRFEFANVSVSGASETPSEVTEIDAELQPYSSEWVQQHWGSVGKTLPGISLDYRTTAQTRGLLFPFDELGDVIATAFTSPIRYQGNTGSTDRQYLRIRAKWIDPWTYLGDGEILLNLATLVRAAPPSGLRWQDVSVAV